MRCFAFPADDGAADAFLRLSASAPSTAIQVTCDHDYDAERRLQIMHRDGFVPGSGPVWKENGRLKTEGRAYSIEEAVSKYAATISARLKSKIALGDDGRSILLVHINDEQLPPEGLPALLEQARVAATGSPFAATVLVGSSDEKQICELIAGSISEL